MTFEYKGRRREVLRKLGKSLLGVFGGAVLFGAANRTAQAGVFAGLFLRSKTPVRIPEGYYDGKLQLYVDTGTGKPMFVEVGTEADRYLSGAELQKLAAELDVEALSKQVAQLGPGESCTLSRDTTYNTTTCCPIVTDSKSDTGCDDTPGK
jgi:hypothetical protein